MDSNRMELHQLIYELFKRQIMFGVHHFEDTLPTMKEASEYFFVSVDTVRKAYLKLKQEGYITLSTGVGAVVSVRYGNRAIRRNIQNFFARRRTALFDLAHSTFPLLSYAQWVSLRYAGPEILDEVEAFCTAKNTPSPYRRVQQFLLIYNSLGNDLLIRLIWQMLLFLQAPFLSYSQNRNYFNGAGPLRDMVQLCRKKDWKALWNAIELFQRQFISALRLFYNERIPKGGGEQVEFDWSIYKESSQICYSLGLKLLHEIREDSILEGTYLSAPTKIAEDNGVSLNTVRRTISILNKLGATQTVNGVGTKVLSPPESVKNRNVTHPVIQNRLLTFAQCAQILTLSCRACAQMTGVSLTKFGINAWVNQLKKVKRSGQYEIMVYTCMEFISKFSPYQALQKSYAQLLEQLFWGYPLRDMHGTRESINAFYLPYLNGLINCLEQNELLDFSLILEQLMRKELEFTVNYLKDLGIPNVSAILVFDDEDITK